MASTLPHQDEIDLMNVDYDDVLHLYRGWRRAEGSLKEKTKELSSLKNRVKQLQDSHVKFRGQIQALESVKELTVILQTQLSVLQQENVQLTKENIELLTMKKQADESLKERLQSMQEMEKSASELHTELAALRGQHAELQLAYRNLETFAADEQALRLAAEANHQAAVDKSEKLKSELRTSKSRCDSTSARLTQCDRELAHASDQLKSLSQEVSHFTDVNRRVSAAEAETSVIKGDIARLLRLLEHYPAATKFLANWQASNGMSFSGLQAPDKKEQFPDFGLSSAIAEEEERQDMLDWEGCGITPAELSQMKKKYMGSDLFPMTATMEEELDLWVPKDAAEQGLKFWSAKLPHAPKSVILDFLRSMNRVWLRRERRKLRRINDVHSQEIADLKRQLSQSRPYRGVLAERQIRCLRQQVKDGRKKILSGRAKNKLEISVADLEDYDSEDELAARNRRYCELVKLQSFRANASAHPVSMEDLSAKKLLEASLVTLETIGRQQQSLHGSGGESGASRTPSRSRHTSPQRAGHDRSTGANAEGSSHPNDSYLKGASWMTKNFVLLAEDLCQEVDEFRAKFLTEVSRATEDSDIRRSCHRLNLLAGSGVNQVMSMVNKNKAKSQSYLQGLRIIEPGDYRNWRSFMHTLPAEASENYHYLNSPSRLSASQLNTTPARDHTHG